MSQITTLAGYPNNHNNNSNSNNNSEQNIYHQTQKDEIRLIRPTWRRYLILVLYGICSMEKSFQWINLSTITNKVAFYYNVENFAVNWTSVLFMITFIPLVLPTSLIIERIGLRKAILIGQSGITLGAIIKCFAIDEDKFWLILLGQIVVSLSEQFIFCVPSKIAAVWFPDEQVSLATGCGIFGNQIGIAAGFIIPQALLNNRNDKISIRIGLEQLFYGTAIIASITMIFLIFLFADQPKHAPGAARLCQLERKRQQNHLATTPSFFEEIRLMAPIIWKLCKNLNCLLLMMAYGLNVGTGYTIQTLLNQMIAGNQLTNTKPETIQTTNSTTQTTVVATPPPQPSDGGMQIDAQNDLNHIVGTIGLVIIFFGMLGALFWGYLCDLTHRYKLITCTLYLGFIFSLIGFDVSLNYSHVQWGFVNDFVSCRYLLAALMGFTMIGYTTAGLDTLVEYTYPIPELLSTSLMVICPQIFGTLLTFTTSAIVDHYGRDTATGFMVITLALGLLISLCVREKLSRQETIDSKRIELRNATIGRQPFNRSNGCSPAIAMQTTKNSIGTPAIHSECA